MNVETPRDDALFRAARELARSGEPWSMSRLANAAGISRTTLYRRFRSRDEVERALRKAGVEATERPRPPRERCLDAVGVLATTVGLARMTLDAVAEEAEVGVATLYRLFGNRRGLLQAFTVERSPRAQLEAAMLDDTARLETTLEALVAGVLRQAFEHAPWLGVAVAGDEESRELASELAAVEREARERLTLFMRRQVRRGRLRGKPRLLAQALLSLAAGRALFSRLDGERPAAEDVRVLVEMFLRGAEVSRR